MRMRAALFGLVVHVATSYSWVNVSSSGGVPAGAVAGGHATVGGTSNATLSVCRALDAEEKAGATSWTPGHLTEYDGSFTESGVWCAFCMTEPAFCYLYDPTFQVLVPDAGEALVWEDSTGTVQDGAVEAGAWASGPAGKTWVCRLDDAKNDRVLPGKLVFRDDAYACCAAAPVDNPNELCTTSWGDIQTYDALVVKKAR